MSMKLPRQFFKPLAIGAPAPLRELPVRLERMIHFVPPHVEKLRAKVPQLISEVDVVLGNLEDAIPADAKQAARDGFIAMAREIDFGTTGLWTRINALNSPWALDDLTAIVVVNSERRIIGVVSKEVIKRSVPIRVPERTVNVTITAAPATQRRVSEIPAFGWIQ